MKQLLPDWEWKPVVEALMACKGFQEVAAMTIISELGDLRRFDHPRKLMAFLGLVPGEDSTGTKRRQGAITKCGNSHARWMLVECSQHYRKAPKVSAVLSQTTGGPGQGGQGTLLAHAEPAPQTLRQTQGAGQTRQQGHRRHRP